MIKAQTLQDLFKRYRRPGDLVFSVVFLIFSVILLACLPSQTTWANGTSLFAQPGFWPGVGVITMSIFAALHLISSLVSPAIAGRWAEVGFWARSVEYAGWFLAYVAVVPVLGYLPATVAVTLLLTLRLGYRSGVMLLSAVGFGIGVVVLFKTLLQVKVPGGQLYESLPEGIRAFMLTYF